ncbi:hypothetical protein E5P85_04540 [Helicobacter pylori]|nr:hypothetical protein E5P85_04540 [Helicobacter pylori]
MNEPFLIRTLKQQKILIKELTPLENALLKLLFCFKRFKTLSFCEAIKR